MAKVNKVTITGASARQMPHGDGREVVDIKDISVAIYPSGRFWFAQGLEIDYISQGTSVDDAKRTFENGLMATIHQHLKVHGDINSLLHFAPPDVHAKVLRKLFQNPNSIKATFSHLSVHDVPRIDIQYLSVAA